MNHIRVRLRIFLVIFLAVILLGAGGIMIAEDIPFPDAIYFAIVTVATVGYGDIHPVTGAGRFVAVLLIVLGVGTFLGVIANTTELILSRREKTARFEKLNMVIGVFFTEVGTHLLRKFSRLDPAVERLRENLVVTGGWKDEDFLRVRETLRDFEYSVDVRREDLEELRGFLSSRRDLLLRLFENPMLLEHEAFTDCLHAVSHLAEELASRGDLRDLPESDLQHLGGDVRRAYGLLVGRWLDYMKYLKENYPYLFSLAMRTNPFDTEASPVVR